MPTKPSKETLGEQIRRARIGKELPLRELARRLEKSPSYLNDIEHDRRIPSEEVLVKIAAELDLDVDQILAAAGRVGGEAEEYMKSNPTAGILFRKVSDAGLDEKGLKRLLLQAEKMIGERDTGLEE
jgi:transcriptional regulator with XRE-family HTH domain